MELLPIDNPFEEKLHLERKSELGWWNYLRQKARVPAQVFFGLAPDDEHRRIVEVYRLCYERSKGADRMDVIRDFATFFPDRVLDAPWLKELVRIETWSREGKPLLRALANGFRRAARKQVPATKAELRRMHLAAARLSFERAREEFMAFQKELKQASTMDFDWINELVSEKVEQLRSNHPRLKENRRVGYQLADLLLKGRTYEAAVKITATLFHVRARDLENKPS